MSNFIVDREIALQIQDLYFKGTITLIEAYQMSMYAQELEPEIDPDTVVLEKFGRALSLTE